MGMTRAFIINQRLFVKPAVFMYLKGITVPFADLAELNRMQRPKIESTYGSNSSLVMFLERNVASSKSSKRMPCFDPIATVQSQMETMGNGSSNMLLTLMFVRTWCSKQHDKMETKQREHTLAETRNKRNQMSFRSELLARFVF